MDGIGAGHGRVRRPACGALLSALMLALALGASAGCAPRREPIVLRPLGGDPDLASRPLFRVRIVRIVHRIRPDAPVEDVWRLLGATDVPYAKRSLWEANDLRLGEGARLAAERMNELMAQTSDRTVHAAELLVRENMDFRATVGTERDELEILWSDAEGRMSGRRFAQAVPGFRLVCRRPPRLVESPGVLATGRADPAVVCLAFVPEVDYVKEAARWVRTPAGPVQQIERANFAVADLAAEVRLGTGRLLVIGGRRRSAVSLGGAIFFEPRGPDLWAQMLILSAEEVPLKEAPEGTTVPFLPPARRP